MISRSNLYHRWRRAGRFFNVCYFLNGCRWKLIILLYVKRVRVRYDEPFVVSGPPSRKITCVYSHVDIFVRGDSFRSKIIVFYSVAFTTRSLLLLDIYFCSEYAVRKNHIQCLRLKSVETIEI